MFTGLVLGMGTVAAVSEKPEGRRLEIEGPLDPRDAAIGASLAVNGTCLTVVEAQASSSLQRVALEAAFETLRLTTLGGLQAGARVNLEPSLRVGDALGGHLVTGHVDTQATLRSQRAHGDAQELWFDIDRAWHKFIAPKGSIALDGVSLTVNEVDEGGFMVGLIPHTLAITTLGLLQPGHAVNVEIDTIARYTARLLAFAQQDPT